MQDDQLDQISQALAQDPPQTEEGQQLVKDLAGAEATHRFNKSSENYNLAQDMDDTLLMQIAQEAFSGFKDDEDSRAEWLDQHAFWLSLYMQHDYAENSDSERSWGATESIPILTEACNQFQSRTYKTFFPNDTFVSAVPMRRSADDRPALEDRADRIGKHMSYQLSFMDRNYRKDKNALFLGVATHGSFFTKTYPKDMKKKPKNLPFKVDNVRPTDLVINYQSGPIRIEDVRRKTHIIRTTVGETEDLVQQGFFTQAATAYTQEGKSVYDVKVDETTGLTEGNQSIKRYKPAMLIEQHAWFQPDPDEPFLPYIVTLDMASRKIMRMVIGWEADPQGNPIDDYEQIQYFTHYKFTENPDGFYGLGLGHFIGDINSAVNIMLRQTMDAATLANDGNMSGFISERLGLEGDEIRMVLGKFIKIPDTVGDIQNGFMSMKFPGPNEALIEIMENLDSRAQRIGSTTEATTGSISKNQQPTTVITEVEQAMEMFSSVQMSLADACGDELMKIFRLNQRYIPLIDYFVVNNAPGQITRADYQDDMLIQPIFDPKFATQMQRVARAQAELQGTMQNPNSQSRPQVFDVAYKRYFKALDVENIDELIPPPPQIQDIDNQDWENSQFMMPPNARQPFDVFPDQNHEMHLQQLEQFIAQQGHMINTPEQVQSLQSHKMKHEAYLYAQAKGLPPPNLPGPVAAAALAGGQGNPMANAQAGGAVSPLASLALGNTGGISQGQPSGGQPGGT